MLNIRSVHGGCNTHITLPSSVDAMIQLNIGMSASGKKASTKKKRLKGGGLLKRKAAKPVSSSSKKLRKTKGKGVPSSSSSTVSAAQILGGGPGLDDVLAMIHGDDHSAAGEGNSSGSSRHRAVLPSRDPADFDKLERAAHALKLWDGAVRLEPSFYESYPASNTTQGTRTSSVGTDRKHSSSSLLFPPEHPFEQCVDSYAVIDHARALLATETMRQKFVWNLQQRLGKIGEKFEIELESGAYSRWQFNRMLASAEPGTEHT